MKPRLINGCAKSPFIVEAFEAMGWDAWTCDLLPAEGNQKHIQDDILKHLDDGWDMGIFHPDCTYPALSGVRWMYLPDGSIDPDRYAELVKSCEFFNKIDNANIPLLCLENPIQHHFARDFIRPYDQIIQPWNFGTMESKATCLWLSGLPKLAKQITVKPEGVRQSVWREAPSEERKANRARTFPSIANAMAEQWGSLANQGGENE